MSLQKDHCSNISGWIRIDAELSSALKWWMPVPGPHNGSNVHVKHPSLLAGHSHTRDKGADLGKLHTQAAHRHRREDGRS